MDFEKIKDAVTSIEMSKAMEDRVKENIGKKKSVPVNDKRWISAACAFGILLAIMIGMPYLTKSGEVTNFSITAYALSDDGKELNTTTITSEKATIDLATEDRMDRILSISGDGANLIFTDIRLKITGEQIDTITYTLSGGKFIEDVLFTYKEYIDREWLQAEKINFITREPSSDEYQGIKEVGSTYTVNYNEQEKHQYSLAIPHDGNEVISGDVIITANVTYTDGKSEQQDIVVTQGSDAISLKLK
ncbi:MULTISPECIES: hypothetical protein [unclassified Sporosarcina]|uniref:hypothetical protein n=1 Tax=unclassified Sporosarcina TaxID=2647733 RepID=UPI00203AA062|nr:MULTISPECIES: hypothetical protein [unclassified Sporosarcina]GKV64348.1 hypothetical protein NCCP2331_05010 [Sporosarcina sp. NCCP-2331]GLB55093.1 hypothetical protein NCCP2378_08790 [Sporosarcina sp. NCCP-2378]